MRKNTTKSLSLLLAASLAFSSAGPALPTAAAQSQSKILWEQSADEGVGASLSGSVQEDSKQDSSKDGTASSELSQDAEKACAVDPQQVIETLKSGKWNRQQGLQSEQEILRTDVSEPQVQDRADRDSQTEELAEETISVKQADEDVPVKQVFEDEVLFQEVLVQYNNKTGQSKTEENFFCSDLSSFSGAIVFTEFANAASVTSLKGLGYAKMAESVNISALTAVDTIPAEEFKGCSFKEFVMPGSIKTIGDKAFLECKRLENIVLPDSLEKLGEQGFAQCSALAHVSTDVAEDTLPTHLKSVGQQAFLEDVAITKISIPAFTEGGSILQHVPGIFNGCSGLSEVRVSNTITTLPVSAFERAGVSTESGLKVVFEEGSQLDKILGSAFRNAKLEETVNLSACSLLTSIQASAFEGVKGTLTVDLSQCTRLGSIENSVFEEAEALKAVILPAQDDGLALGDRVFAKTKVTSVYASGSEETEGILLPDYISKIGAGCFVANVDMKMVSLPAGIPMISDYTFDGCKSLKEVIQRQGSDGVCNVQEIGDAAFRGTAIENTEFLMQMNRLQKIGYQKLEGLTTYKYPNSESDESDIAFLPEGGEGVTEVDAESHQKWIEQDRRYCGSDVFAACPELKSIHIPSCVQEIGARAFFFSKYKEGSVPSQVESIVWESGDAGENVKRVIYTEAFGNHEKSLTLTLPENKGVGEQLTIGRCAFYNNSSMQVVKGDSGDNVLPATVVSLESGAFYLCASLPSIQVQATESGTCPQLQEKVFKWCNALSQIELPAQIQDIPRHFCYGDPIQSIKIGDGTNIGVRKIGSLAFMGNVIENLDLTAYTKLEELDSGCFAYMDMVIESEEPEKTSSLPIYPVHDKEPVMKSVLLPAEMEKEQVFMNTGVFSGQLMFETMKIPGGPDGQIFIPDYLYEQEQQAIFAMTAVKKVVWEADTTHVNEWKEVPVLMYMGCDQIENAEDVIPTGDYVTSLGKGAFAVSLVKSADLSGFTRLELLGSGTIAGDNKTDGVFWCCPLLSTVTLPVTQDDVELVVGNECFMKCPFLGAGQGIVGLGSAVKLEEKAFQQCEGLNNIAFSPKLREIANNVFEDCTNLTLLNNPLPAALETIGNECFKNCTSLTLTGCELPEKLKTIGSNAFQGTKKLGEVVFGAQLTRIGDYAFEGAGVTKLVFDKAASLEEIGSGAFTKSTLPEIRLFHTNVKRINSNVFSNCRELKAARFGSEVLYIDEDALAGCKNLTYLEFASTTTVNNRVFYTPYWVSEEVEEDGQTITKQVVEYTADGGTITVSVTTPEKTLVPLGRTINLPYYINEAGTSQFDYILVGDKTKHETEDETVKTHVKINARLNDGYYWYRQTDEEGGKYRIKDPEYLRDLKELKEPSTTIKREEIDNKEVDVIEIEGLAPTKEPLDFSVVCSIRFECAPDEDQRPVTVTASKFAADYRLEIEDVPLGLTLYQDDQRQEQLTVEEGDNTQFIQLSSSTHTFQYYFDVMSESQESKPDTYDIVITTDNKDVIYPAGSSSGEPVDSYETDTGTNTNESTGTITPNPSGQNFWLIVNGVGEANITMCPKGHPEYAVTYKYVINSDIQTLTLSVPEAYNSGAKAGDSFSVFNNYSNYLEQVVDQEHLDKMDVYSNRKITYESSDLEYASVDEKGVVTILKGEKAGGSDKWVTIKASAQTSIEDSKLESTVDVVINPNAPVFASGIEAMLYSDENCERLIQDNLSAQGQTTRIQLSSDQLGTQYYYDVIMVSEEPDAMPETYDLVVETDNPDVLYPAKSSSEEKQASYTVEATDVDSSTGVVSASSYYKNFWLIASGIGTAHIKVYPKGHVDHAKTYTFEVNSDLKLISLAVPDAYKDGMKPGDVFNVFESFQNYLGQPAADSGVPGSAYGAYTNRVITFSSSEPGYAAVDAMGNVTILKIDPDSKQVKLVAEADTSEEGVKLTTELTMDVRYPDIRTDEPISDPVSGAQVAVTTQSKVDLEGEVKYVNAGGSKTVTVPDTVIVNGVQYKVTSIDESAFKNNKTLQSVKLGKYVTQIDAEAFSGCTALTSVTVNSEVTKIGDKAFYNCKKLKTITLPTKANITEIGDSAFENCAVLAKITIPAKITRIGNKAFSGCKKLKTVTFAGKSELTTIGDNAFAGCKTLAKITLPAKLTGIGIKAFYNCKKLKKITVKSKVLDSVGEKALKNIHKKAVIKVPKKQLSKYKTLFQGKGQKKTVKVKK